MVRIAVMGAGTWGTAFSLVLADAGNSVRLWARRREVCATINARRENVEYLPAVRLPDAIHASQDASEVLGGADVVVLAVPSQTLRNNLGEWAPKIPDSAVLVSLMKGIERGTHQRMSQVIAEVTGADPAKVAVVTGPNLAREIAERQPSASVVACRHARTAQWLQSLCHTRSFRPYTNADVVGCELGGAIKNVIALAVGMTEGLRFGDNAKASVITRGLAETGRLATALGADPMTLSGLAGLGDLVATCSSPLSRNRSFGQQLGQGRTVDQIIASTRQVAEGVESCESIHALARAHDVDMPIVEHVAAVVRGDLGAEDLVVSLVSRSAKPERR